jgi:hypothetical protein
MWSVQVVRFDNARFRHALRHFWFMRRIACLGLAVCCAAVAQDAAKLRDALEWTIAQRGRMQQMTNRVVQVHGIASLGMLVCPEDRSEGSGLFRQAIAALHGVPQSAFRDKGTTVLPVASFSGLWKYVVPAALKCDPGLADAANNSQSKARLEEEKRSANQTLESAWALIDPSLVLDKADNNDRAAQMANAALDAGDPDVLNIVLLTRFMSQLRDRAPDLSDDLFQRALDFVMSATVPNPGSLQELAKYLFTSPKYLDQPDTDQNGENFQMGGVTIEMLTATRVSANPDDIEALIGTTLRLLKLPTAAAMNPSVAYALSYQLIPRARDLAPDRVNDLQDALSQLASQVSSSAQIEARLGPAENPDQYSGDPAYRDFQLTGRIKGELAAGRIDRAREWLSRITDSDTRSQLAELIKFTEAGRAVEAHSDQALPLANRLRGGIKRSLIYVGIIGNAVQPDAALQVLPLAVHEVEPLPAEQRIRLLAGITAALVKTDTQSAAGTLDLLVRAYNDVYSNPRRGRFEPRAARQIFSRDAAVDTSTDSSLILAGTRGMYEAVQTERGRHNFVLKVPGVSALNLASFLMAAGAIEPGRLEGTILGLRDENTRAQALVRIGDLRIRTAKAASKRAQ